MNSLLLGRREQVGNGCGAYGRVRWRGYHAPGEVSQDSTELVDGTAIDGEDGERADAASGRGEDVGSLWTPPTRTEGCGPCGTLTATKEPHPPVDGAGRA